MKTPGKVRFFVFLCNNSDFSENFGTKQYKHLRKCCGKYQQVLCFVFVSEYSEKSELLHNNTKNWTLPGFFMRVTYVYDNLNVTII